VKFPIFKTKIEGLDRKPSTRAKLGAGPVPYRNKVSGTGFNLIDPGEQKEYFQSKAGKEIEKLREYLKENSFIAYLLGKKNSGKGTYSKMFAEVVDPEKIDHFSIGDMVREVDKELETPESKKELIDSLEKQYRGFLPLKEAISALEKRNTETLLPTELILALVKREIAKRKKKTLFIDGFPRDLDQISYSLFFRDLIGYREDPDIFILIDVPEAVIDERIKWRRVCPLCQTSRNFKLLPTSKVNYDETKKEFYLLCDNPHCKGAKLLPKEGDELGIEPIRERLKMDEKLMEKAFSLYGIPKVLLRNSVPAKVAKNYIDDYEITPEYIYEWDEKEKIVKIIEKPWQVRDDEGIPSYSLLPPPVVVSLIKQMIEVLNL
jgi:adenylate kinase family enzyme